MIKAPYLLFLGDAPDQLAAKVAQGIPRLATRYKYWSNKITKL